VVRPVPPDRSVAGAIAAEHAEQITIVKLNIDENPVTPPSTA